jgi:hypothetical protein
MTSATLDREKWAMMRQLLLRLQVEAERQIEPHLPQAFLEVILYKIDQENVDWREGNRRPEV